MWKRHLQTVFKKESLLFTCCRVARHSPRRRRPMDCLYFSKLKTIVNLHIILALLEFVVHYVESQFYFTSPCFVLDFFLLLFFGSRD